jgi:UDP-N-acetylmuramate--alanine ligase
LRSSRELEGRRLWFAGIGGAGMSGYALLAHAWGADVSGWDRVETPYLGHLPDSVRVDLSAEPPEPPAGWEAIVSSAYAARVPGRSRGEFLAELVHSRRSIVVAGAHGKSTTTAMIAFVLRELGHDPAYLIGADVPQLGGNAGSGTGWLVVEGDESDRTIELLRPQIAVLTNVDLDHHATFASRAEVEALFDDWLTRAAHAVRGDRLAPYDGALAVPGAHNRRNAAAALAALELAGVARAEATPALEAFRGVARRLEHRGDPAGVRLVDDYGHHPAEVAAALAAVRDGGRVLVVFQPHLYSRTRHLAREFAVALSAADVAAVTDVYPAREEPVEGVSGKLIVDALAELRPGMSVAWMPDRDDAARFVATHARRGDTILTLGAGDVDAAVPLLADLLR